MIRMPKIFLISIFIVLIVVGSVKEGCACSCTGDAPIALYNKMDMVFTGKVQKLENRLTHNNQYRHVAILQIDNILKGEKVNEVEVYLSSEFPTMLDADKMVMECEYRFEQKKEYLVYAFKDKDGNLFTNDCSGTKPLNDETKKEIKTLKNLSIQN